MKTIISITTLLFILVLVVKNPLVAQKTSPSMYPSGHHNALTKSQYANGALREKDAIKRTAPRISAEMTKKGLHLGNPVFIRILKESRELELWVKQSETGQYRHFKTWRIAALSGSLGPKLAEGDFQGPEGFYHVPISMMKPDSNYHLAFNIGYPNSYDKAHKRTGSFIMVHGNRLSAGCFAMTDPSIEEIYTICHAALSNKNNNRQKFFRVHVFPFHMTTQRMEKAQGQPWFSFWQNLQEGYDYFEKHRTPPNVKVVRKRYVFE